MLIENINYTLLAVSSDVLGEDDDKTKDEAEEVEDENDEEDDEDEDEEDNEDELPLENNNDWES